MCQNVQQQCLLVELEVVSGCTLAQKYMFLGERTPYSVVYTWKNTLLLCGLYCYIEL